MPGAEYTVSCSTCEWEIDFSEGANHDGGHWYHWCTKCGFLDLVNQRGIEHKLVDERPARCPTHGEQSMEEFTMIDIVCEHGGVTDVPCTACGIGKLRVEESGVMWD